MRSMYYECKCSIVEGISQDKITGWDKRGILISKSLTFMRNCGSDCNHNEYAASVDVNVTVVVST
jgi:hypothetical protein